MLERDATNAGSDDQARVSVLIAGGGVAALETALGLHQLAGDRVRTRILAPGEDFSYRPMAVVEPFDGRPPRRLALTKLTEEIGADLEYGTLVEVDPEARLVRTADRLLEFDALVIAVGARTREALPGAMTLDPSHMADSLRGVIEDIRSGSVRRLGLVSPRPSWPLPVYEIALQLKAMADEKGIDLSVTIITAETRPVAAFGESASAGVAAVLADAGIRTMTGSQARMDGDEVVVTPGDHRLQFDRVVAFPQLQGPAIMGLPSDPDGFLPVDAHGAVTGVERVYAAGDATDFPVKFGGVSARQADAVAESIATMSGAMTSPEPFEPVIHGLLLTGSGREPLYLSATLDGDVPRDSVIGDAPVGDAPSWAPEAKIAARYLAPYLDERWASGIRWLRTQLSWETLLK